MIEGTLPRERENQLLDYLSVLFLCVFWVFSSLNFPFTSLLFLIAAVVLRLFAILHEVLDWRILAPGGAMLLWVTAGLLSTPDFSEGVRFLLRLLLCLLMGYMATRSRAYMRLLIPALFASSLLVLASVYWQLLLPDATVALYERIMRPNAYEMVMNAHKYFEKRPAGICGYTSTTGYLLAVLSGMAFVRALSRLRERRFSHALLYGAVFVLSLTGIMLVSKRSLFLATIAICVLFLLFYYTRRAGQRVAMIVALVTGIAALLLVMHHSNTLSAFFDRLTNIENDYYSSGRLDIYPRTWALFLQNPLLGRGSGSFIKLYGDLYGHLGGGAHNIYLQLLCENGVPGLLLIGGFLATNLVSAIRALRRDRKNDLLCFSVYGQLVFLFYGFFGNPLYDEILLCVYCLLAFIPYLREEPDHA